MKILHSADLHLDSPFLGHGEAEAAALRRAQRAIADRLASLCRAQECDMLLLSGDLFDGAWTQESAHALADALREAAVPTFISPGNHDFCAADSPWMQRFWPENVHIFRSPEIESVAVPQLDCRVYGAGFTSMDCPALLENFTVCGDERYHIAVLHGDPLQKHSPYDPITQAQVAASELDYLALGHVHKSGMLRAGKTLCAWPGCPMGRGFDETDEKGVLLVTLDSTCRAEFLPLDTPRFYDQEAEIILDPAEAVASVLPAAGSEDYYRVTLTGEWNELDLPALAAQFPQFPHLQLRARTVPITDLWAEVGRDSLEGVYFGLLHDALQNAEDDATRERLTLAARLSRRILDGREVQLP